jgi:hypothetical protein
MPFSEIGRINMKRRADFTCCLCKNRDNKVDVYHIIPRSEDGPDDEENAVPLYGSCHTKFGDSPSLRKEIKERRDAWYLECESRYKVIWPTGIDVPLLSFVKELLSQRGLKNKGIQFSDCENVQDKKPSLLLPINRCPSSILCYDTQTLFPANRIPRCL